MAIDPALLTDDGMEIPGTGPSQYAGEWEMFDLENDPHELRNIFHDPDYREERNRMVHRLWIAQQSVGDTAHPRQIPIPTGRGGPTSPLGGRTSSTNGIARQCPASRA